jgi:hypothetical protein
VTVAFGGQVILQTVTDDPGWVPTIGERLATIGPLQVPSGIDLVARFMETRLPPGPEDALRIAGGRAIFVLGGTLCVETPDGARDIPPRSSLILPAGVPSAETAREPVQALVLAIHPATGNGVVAPAWTASGVCRA